MFEIGFDVMLLYCITQKMLQMFFNVKGLIFLESWTFFTAHVAKGIVTIPARKTTNHKQKYKYVNVSCLFLEGNKGGYNPLDTW